MTISCIICQKEYSIKGIHTHYERTHGDKKTKEKYSNGNNGKYKIISDKLKQRKENIISEYKPEICKCGSPIPYEKRKNKFCSRSCANSRGPRSESFKIAVSQKIKQKTIKTTKTTKIKEAIQCKFCKTQFTPKRKKAIFCSKRCSSYSQKKDVSGAFDLATYRNLCKFNFNVYEFPEEFDMKLVETFGWYSPKNKKNNMNGVSRDHMVSVRFGFDNKIDPKLLSHPANCNLLLQSANASKNTQNSISIEELKERIELWNEKYNMS